RPPVRPFPFLGHLVGAGPFEARLACADAVPARPAILFDQIEEVLARIEDHRARLLLPVTGGLRRQVARILPPFLAHAPGRRLSRGGAHAVRFPLARIAALGALRPGRGLAYDHARLLAALDEPRG